MPFKGMLKWAIAKEDLKQSATTTATTTAVNSSPSARNLKNSKRRHQHNHNKHNCCAVIHKVAENNAKNIGSPPANEVDVLGERGGDGGGVGANHQKKCEQSGVTVADKGAKKLNSFEGESRLSPLKSGALDNKLKGERRNLKMGNSQSPQKGVVVMGMGGGFSTEANNNRTENQAIHVKRVPPNPMKGGGGGGNRGSQADSKSLLYMSLDHLPLAIVKQYERMLQETNAQIPTSPSHIQQERKKGGGSQGQRSKTAEDVEIVRMKKAEVVQTKKKIRSATVVVNPKDLKMLENMERKPLQGIIKEHGGCGGGGQDNPKKVVKIISPTSQSQGQQQQTKQTSSSAPVVKIKEAKRSQLPVHSVDSFNRKKSGSCGVLVHGKRKSPSPDLIRNKNRSSERSTQGGGRNSPPKGGNGGKGRFKVTIVSTPPATPEGVQSSQKKDVGVETEAKLFPLKSILKDCKSSTLPRSLSISGSGKSKKQSSQPTNCPTTLPPQRSNSFRTPSPSEKQYQSLHNLSTMATFNSTSTPSPPIPSTTIRPHDVTDPQFLEMPISIHTPAVSRCAKKLTLKRSELRKLQRIQNQTEKLNRFLKKYYRLPNLPEEEEEACSPEEKSVHLSALRKHWIVQNGPEEGVTSSSHPLSRRNTLPTHLRLPPPPPLQSPHDNLQESPSNLLSSSAFYSDPLLSSLPNKIESPELLLEHHRRLTKQKSCTNLRRSSVTSSCSSSCSTCSTSSGSCTNSSCKIPPAPSPSIATSIINSSSDYRQTEVHRANTSQYSHSLINESFLMSSSHHRHHSNRRRGEDSDDDDQDNSLLALQERELLLRRCPDSSKNLVVMPTLNGNTELACLSLPVLQESFLGQEAVAMASPIQVVELACIKNDTNNNSKENGSNKSCGKVMMISPLSFSDEECSESALNTDGEDDELLEADQQHPNPQSEKTCALSASMMSMRRGEEDDGKLKGWKTRRTIDNDQQHDQEEQDGEMITGGKQPLAAQKKNPFEKMPPVLPPRQVVEEHGDLDEGFMSPYPHEGYSPSGSHSSGGSSITCGSLDEEKIQRLSVSSGKGSSAEDLQEEDEENLELFFLDSTTGTNGKHQQEMNLPCKGDINHLNLNLNNYFNEIGEGDEDDDEEDYVTLSGTSNSSATTNTTAVCGSFFPNSNSFQIGTRQSCHGRQVSSDDSYSVYYAPSISSSCGLYATVAGDEEHEHNEQGEEGLRCENSHLQGGTGTGSIINYYDIPEEQEREHIYDEVAVGQKEEDAEESVIIQSAHLPKSGNGGNFGGIAFSTPINKERVYMPGIRRKRSFNIDDSSYINGSLKGQMRTKNNPKTPKSLNQRRVISKKYTTPVVKKTPYSGKGEVLIRCYRNGNYVTVHVIQARNLQMSYRSSWKLSMKISLIPEGEGTLTKCESVTVARAKGSVRIDQKFSFELPSSSQQACSSREQTRRKVFLTFIKRIAEKRSSTFLGWITLEVPEESNEQQNFPQSQQQHWLKLRKRKMSNVSYSSCGPPPPSSSATSSQKAIHLNHPGDSSSSPHHPQNYPSSSTIMVGLPPPPPSTGSGPVGNGGVVAMVTTNNHHCYSSDNDDHEEDRHHDNFDEDNDELNNHHMHNHHNHHHHSHHHQIQMNNQYNNLKINCHIQNSNTMDSGVEDCCERETAMQTANHPQVMAVAPQQQQQQHPSSQLEVPCIELDDKLGFRVRVRMEKQEGSGFGFSVVWVSPPRIERLEKDKTADVAGLKIGDLIIGVNGDDVTNVPNTIIYNKMKSTGMTLDLEVWRKHPHAPSPLPAHHMNVPNPINPTQCVPPPPPPGVPPPVPSGVASPPPPPPVHPSCQQNANANPSASAATTALPKNSSSKNAPSEKTTPAPPISTTTSGLPPPSAAAPRPKTSSNPLIQRILEAQAREQAQAQQNPQSILKPPQQNPPGGNSHSPLGRGNNQQSSSSTQQSSSWRIRFNIELLDNEDDNLKQFFICELKFFRKVVAALDRYLIPAQAKRLLTPQEIHLIFAQVIKIITMTKRILQCVANGSNNSTWKLGRILLSTHTDHLPDITSAYTAYARGLAHSAMILSEKMSIKEFAKFVVETPVPKGHLDMTSLLFAPFEHLRNLCEIAEEISHHHHDNWVVLNTRLKECYADIVCETDFMEPISHLSMKKNPLLSVRDLEKRIISTTSQQPLKVCEKGRKWLFGSRLYRRETDGSWSPVWAFLFTDIIVLTSHMTRDRVFFVKETPIRLDDVVTLHFNLPKKHENEFRLLFGPDSSHHSRLDRILPLVRSKKPNQVVLRTANTQLKSLWKLLLQRQIISLNTRLSKSSSSNFSISEFCEKFPVVQHDSIMEEDEAAVVAEDRLEVVDPQNTTNLRSSPAIPRQTTASSSNLPQPRTASFSQNPPKLSEKLSIHPSTPMPVNRSSSVKKPIPIHPTHHPTPSNPLLPPPPPTKEIMIPPPQQISIQKAEHHPPPPRSSQVVSPPYVPDGLSILNRDLLKSRVTRRPSIPPGSGTSGLASESSAAEDKPKSATPPVSHLPSAKAPPPPQHMDASTSTGEEISAESTNHVPYGVTAAAAVVPPVPKARTSLVMKDTSSHNTPTHQTSTRVGAGSVGTPSQSPIPTHNNNNNTSTSNPSAGGGPPGEKCPCEKIQPQEPQAYPSPKPRQLSALKRTSTTTPPPPPLHHQPPEVNVVAASPLVVKRQPSVPPTSSEVSQPSTPKSKPGSRIMTNATIKSMASQQQQQQQSQHSQQPPPPPPGGTKPSISTETIKTDKSSDTSCTTASKATEASTTSTQYFSLKEESSSTTSVSSIQHHPHPSPSSSISSSGVKCGSHLKSMQVHHQHHAHHCPAGLCGGGSSGSPHHQHLNVPPQGGGSLPPRCHSENSHHPLDHPGTSLIKRGKPVHTDSPIIGAGFSSERARRRMTLFDNKLKKDYPELFGITPKDRRSFIKQLGETTEEVLGGGKALVAPYYYTMSPVPIAKHAMMMTMQLVHNKSQQQALAGGGGVGGGVPSSAVNAKVSPPGTGKSPLVIPPFNPNGKKSKINKVPTSPSPQGDDGGGGGGVVGGGMTIPPKNGKGDDDGGDEEEEKRLLQMHQHQQKFKIRRASAGGGGLTHENSSSILEEISSKNWQKTHHYSAAIEEVTSMFREGMFEEEDEGQRLKEFVEKMRQDMESKLGGRRESSLPTTEEGEDLEGVEEEDEEDDSDDEEEEEEEDSDDDEEDDSTPGDEEEEEGFLHSLQGTHSSSGQSHRSHEESSNDSGISDEMTEKSKSVGSAGGGGGVVIGRHPGTNGTTGNNFASRMMMSQQQGGGGNGGANHVTHQHLMEAEVKNVLVKNGKKLCKNAHSSSSASSSSKTSCSSTVASHVNVSSKNCPSAVKSKTVSSTNNPLSQSKKASSAIATSATSGVDLDLVQSSQCVVDVARVALVKKDDDKLVKKIICQKNHSQKIDADSPSSSYLNSLKGEATGSVEAVVVLKSASSTSTSTATSTPPPPTSSPQLTADKATETTQDDFNFLLNLNNKPLRSILAERREAFFTSGMQPSISQQHHHHHQSHLQQQHPSSTNCTAQKFCASSACNCAAASMQIQPPIANLHPAEPLIVKIVEGGTLHSTKEECTSQNKDKELCCERVQLQRLERQKKAKVERVESSEDSTSSSLDLASASPGAAENGTTDPSWSSSSSSSLAGEEKPRKNSPTVDVATSTADTMLTSSNDLQHDMVSPPQPLPLLEEGNGVEVVESLHPSSVVSSVAVAVASPPVVNTTSGLTTTNRSSCCSSVTFEPSSASSSSFQESSTTSSKSYSLLLESDFSSFDSIEPPPSTSTSNTGGGDSNGGGGGGSSKKSVTIVTSTSTLTSTSTTSNTNNSSSNANNCSTKSSLVTIDEPCGGSGGGSTTSSDESVSSKNSSPEDSISSNNNNNNNSEMNKLLESSGASDLEESNDKIDDNSDKAKVTTFQGGATNRFPIFGGGLGGDGNNRVVVVVSKNVSDLKDGPDIVVTQESDEEEEEEEEMEEENSSNSSHGSTRSRRHFSFSSEDEEEEEEEEDSIVLRNGKRGGGLDMEGVVVGVGGIDGGKGGGDTSVASEDGGEESSSINSNRSTNGSYKQGGGGSGGLSGGSGTSPRGSFHLLRVESNDSSTAAENFGDDDDLIGGFGGGGGLVFDGDIGLGGGMGMGMEGEEMMEVDGDGEGEEEEGDLSHCSVATINRYGTFESLEKLESEDTLGAMPDFPGGGGRGGMSRSKARFTFEDEDDDEDDEDLFEEDFETDFNFRFPSQIQDNTYSVSRLGPLPPLLEEDYEDDMYDETRASGYPSSSECSSSGTTTSTAYLGGEYSGGIQGSSSGAGASSLRSRHETGLRRDNSFLLARLATMYARSSISPLKILRELWLKKSRQQPVPAPAPQETPTSLEQEPGYHHHHHHQQPSFSPSSTTLQTSPISTMAVQGIASYTTQQSSDSSSMQSSQQKLVLIKSSDSEEMIFLAETSSLPDSPMVMMAVVPVPLSSLEESSQSSSALEGFSSLPPHPPPPPEFSDYPMTAVSEAEEASTTLEISQGEISSQVLSMSPEGATTTPSSSSTISPADTTSSHSGSIIGAVITENSPTNTSI